MPLTNTNGSVGVGSGIRAGAGSNVSGNAARSNQGFGLEAESGVGYAGNVFSNNNGESANDQVNQGIDAGANVCGTTLSCPRS